MNEAGEEHQRREERVCSEGRVGQPERASAPYGHRLLGISPVAPGRRPADSGRAVAGEGEVRPVVLSAASSHRVDCARTGSESRWRELVGWWRPSAACFRSQPIRARIRSYPVKARDMTVRATESAGRCREETTSGQVRKGSKGLLHSEGCSLVDQGEEAPRCCCGWGLLCPS